MAFFQDIEADQKPWQLE